MNHNRGDINNLSCYLHPNKLVIGVCSLCLKERLLILASKQEYQYSPFRIQKKKVATVAGKFPAIFRLSSFPRLFDLHRPKHDDISSSSSQNSSILSLDDTYISMKFDRGKCTRKKDKSMVENGKQMIMLTWRKPIRYIFKLVQWSWPSKKGRKCHVGVGVNG